MINMGDEVRRTQNGNNNAYCQDNETSWFDWTLLEEARGRASLRQAAQRPSTVARDRTRTAAHEPEPPHRASEQGVAWRASPPIPDWSDESQAWHSPWQSARNKP
jgi:glycogen operon protein